MPHRLRKLIGTLLLLVFVPTYAFMAMAVAAAVLPETSGLVQLVYYVVAGVLWVLPAGLIVSLTFRPPAVR